MVVAAAIAVRAWVREYNDSKAISARDSTIVQKQVEIDELVRDQTIQGLLLSYVEVMKQLGGGDVRANVMLPSDGRLRIAYQVGFAQDTCELDLSWEPGQGCAGTAWVKGEPHSARLDFVGQYQDFEQFKADPANQGWRLDRERWEATKQIKTILSQPILVNGKTVGVLNIDDTQNSAASPILKDESAVYHKVICKQVADALVYPHNGRR